MIQPNMPVLDTCGSQDWKRHGNDMSPPADMFSSESQKYTTAIVFNGSGNECMGKCSDLSYNIQKKSGLLRFCQTGLVQKIRTYESADMEFFSKFFPNRI